MDVITDLKMLRRVCERGARGWKRSSFDFYGAKPIFFWNVTGKEFALSFATLYARHEDLVQVGAQID